MFADDSADDIERTAAAWAVRHPLDAAETARLERWMREDPRHAGALLRAQAAWSLLDSPAAMSASKLAEAIRIGTGWPGRRAFVAGIGGAIAASLAGTLVWPRLFGERTITMRGEIRRLPLRDGSVATIDTESEVEVALRRDVRRVALIRGQAWFQVAKDAQRPFIVDAGAAQVRAVGTAFSVRRTDAGVEVAVTEGTVATWASDAEGAMSILNAGQFATFARPGSPPVTGTAPQAIERALAWREGEIALEGETLADAVAQFNRYNGRRLVVEDAALADERLVGLFRIGDPAGFASTVAATLDTSVTETPAEIRIARKKPAPG